MENVVVYQKLGNVTEFINSNLLSIAESQPCDEKTRLKYYRDMVEFSSWLNGEDFSIDSVMKYRNDFLAKKTDIISSTKNIKLTALRILCEELYFRGVVPINISSKIKNFKVESGHKKDGVNGDEVELVREYIDSIEDERKRVRLQAMFSLLIYQGLRQFEICNIVVEDFRDKKVKIVGKGQSDKIFIDLHPQTVDALKRYLILYGKKSGYMFTSEKGQTIGERLTESGFRRTFFKIFEKLGIDRSTHGFRHFFVTTMLEATNGNIGIVKKFSRHKSTAALEMYDDRKKKKEHNEIFFNAFKTIYK